MILRSVVAVLLSLASAAPAPAREDFLLFVECRKFGERQK
jgi:hypothetical protein